MSDERVRRGTGRKMDRYGWFQSDKKPPNAERKFIITDEKKEEERTKKWLKMLNNWDTFLAKKYKTLSQRVKKGIPDALRGKAWQTIIGQHEIPAPVSQLLAEGQSGDTRTIDADVPRVLPRIGFFSRHEFLDSLKRLLYAYCHVDEDLGYTQGMTSIAGILLSYMSEDDAFVCFVNIMKGPLDHRLYYVEGFPKLETANRVLGGLFKRHNKRAWKSLTRCGVDMTMFTPRWFFTAFQGYNWHPQLSLRIFDRFLFFGTRALLGFALTILILHSDVIETEHMEDICQCLQHPDRSERMGLYHNVLDVWESVWIPKSQFESLWALAS